MPDTYLLHNPEFLRMWKGEASREELRSFLTEGRPVISMGQAEHLLTFQDHYRASTKSNNPSVIPAENGGENFACDLDDFTKDADIRRYDHVSQLKVFPELFLEEARRAHLDEGIAEQALRDAHRISSQDGHASDRYSIDSYSGVTRSGLVRLFRSIPTLEIRNRESVIWECARQAYARNIAKPLRWRWQESQTPIVHQDQLDRSVVYELRQESDILDRLRWSAGSKPYQIDWMSVSRASWPRIRSIADTAEPANVFLNCKRNLLANSSYLNLENLAKALMVYIDYLAKEFPTSSSGPPTAVNLLRFGGFFVYSLASSALARGWLAAIAVIVASYFGEKRVASFHRTRSEVEGERRVGGAVRLLASHRWLEDCHDRTGGDG